jgi:hypothetical protein
MFSLFIKIRGLGSFVERVRACLARVACRFCWYASRSLVWRELFCKDSFARCARCSLAFAFALSR